MKESEVAQALREVAQPFPGRGIDLFGENTEIVAEFFKQLNAHILGAIDLPEKCIGSDQPTAAGDKIPLFFANIAVAMDKRPDSELSLNSVSFPTQTIVMLKAETCCQQECGIKLVRSSKERVGLLRLRPAVRVWIVRGSLSMETMTSEDFGNSCRIAVRDVSISSPGNRRSMTISTGGAPRRDASKTSLKVPASTISASG
ncbi:hypothetical protein [Neorhizobium sp. JUb45]|uniref:hypothetical protein n=1 Tax=Neorhizobium sp. JUb45 TaxID=2485113 RepID=UPI001404BCD0|nr:hypothetical protein [Neorhizobium sp. JUb45]